MAEQEKKQEELPYVERLAQAMKSMKRKPLKPMDTDGLIGNLPGKMPDRFKRK